MTLLRFILIQIPLAYSSQKAVQTCEEPPDVDFGDIISGGKSEYVESDRVQYHCNPGYMLAGSEWISCNGSWTPPPKCLAPCTITKEQLEDKNIFLDSNRRRTILIPSAQTIEFSCSNGYKLTTPFVRTCVDGHIHFPLCISETGKKCGCPPTIANGDITTFALKEYASGFSVEYKCQRFYTLTGQNTSFCNNGNWTKPPVCLEPCAVSITEMQSRGVELSGSSKGKEYICHGELVEFKCQLGYALPALSSTSNFTARCHSGQISYPQCNKDLLKSDSPPYIENGVLSSDLLLEYEAGSTVEYKCRRFYTVKGSKIVTCHLGKWRDLPTCLGK
ncbi:coagulation factor XIII B chain [Alligator mississippiensis]|uniref:coagulation factor XIII B chain n=1 Tax=Alligator mississippiensis TaxID=8496 RepID=UPI002877E0B2|nr:coagulation factor XIII B chain [Alligator mississippiensis]